MKKKGSFWLVGYSIAVLMLGTNIPSPLYGVYKNLWHFSSLTLTLIFATYALVLIPSLALFGRLSDRIGRKKVIWLGALVSILASCIFIFSTHIIGLFLARAFQGLAVGLLSSAATASLIELNPFEEKKVASLIASLVTAGGTAFGPLVGGLLAQYSAHPLTSPFLAHLVLGIPSFIGILFITETVSKNHVKTNDQKKGRRSSVKLSSNVKRAFRLSAVTAFLAWSITALFMSVIPSYVSTLLHIKNLGLTGGVVFLMLVASVLAQIIFKKWRSHTSLRVGLFLLTIGLLFIVFAVPIQSILLMVLGTMISGVGQGLGFKGSLELVQELAPPDQLGAIISQLYVVIYLGVGLPIIGVGSLALTFGLYRSILIFTCLVGSASLIMVFYFLRDREAVGKKSSQSALL